MKLIEKFIVVCAVAALAACEQQEPSTPVEESAAPTMSSDDKTSIAPVVDTASEEQQAKARLNEILAAQTEETKARYAFRNPKETIQFFNIKPGMTVVEVLPGGGWYSQILVPYLGDKGKIIGIDYAGSMWPLFDFGTPEFIKTREERRKKWLEDAKTWGDEDRASAEMYVFGELPEELNGSADVVLFIRALHNLSRFEDQGGYLSSALKATHRLLKPGGIVGIVQHEVDESVSDASANGSRGYMKVSNIKRVMSDAGFGLIEMSEINKNPADKPGESDIVWRLPPNMVTSKDDPELAEKLKTIGESNRATMVFFKRPVANK